MYKSIIINGLVLLSLAGCSAIEPKPFEQSTGHIKAEPAPRGEIPELVEEAPPILPEPAAPVELEKYTVVVNEVPVKELLFALARDSQVNVDIDPDVTGVVTLNAVDQTMPQILDRISQQADIRYEFKGDNLLIKPDKPYLRSYKIGYINMNRDTTSEVAIATQIATTGGAFEGGGGGGGSTGASGGGNNNSTTEVKNVSTNRFWENLVKNVQAILEENVSGGSATGIPISKAVIPSPETGILTVRATHRQHAEVQKFLDLALESAHRQVLIQATIVLVDLSDQYQAGINWSFLNSSAGISVDSLTDTGNPTGTLSSLILTYADLGIGSAGADALNVTVELLEEFGDVRVLSSPQLMAMNNQTAVLKVVDNEVFFTLEQQTDTTQGVITTSFETTIHTVPVGIVMSLTPQINDNGGIILNVRPTISRVFNEVEDPNPALTTPNRIPEIRVREMESVLRLNNGQIGVLGGLMQDETRDNNNSIPGFSKIPLVGKAFETKTKEYFKSELVIFLRPVIVNTPDIDRELDSYRTFLEKSQQEESSL